MIIDTLSAAAEKLFYPPVIRRVLRTIMLQEPATLPSGKYTIEGDNIFFNVVEGHTLPLAQQKPEYHRQYIDIHIVLDGSEIIGCGNKGLPIIDTEDFDKKKDLGFCQPVESETLIHLQPSELAIIFPGEVHRPMSALDAGAPLRKMVVKINHDLLQE